MASGTYVVVSVAGLTLAARVLRRQVVLNLLFLVLVRKFFFLYNVVEAIGCEVGPG